MNHWRNEPIFSWSQLEIMEIQFKSIKYYNLTQEDKQLYLYALCKCMECIEETTVKTLESNTELYRKVHNNIWSLYRDYNGLQRKVVSGAYSVL